MSLSAIAPARRSPAGDPIPPARIRSTFDRTRPFRVACRAPCDGTGGPPRSENPDTIDYLVDGALGARGATGYYSAPRGFRMLCFRCRVENREGARFCRECAAPLGAVCPNCGAELETGSKFCDACGSPLAVTRTQPAAPTFLA